MNSYFFSSRRRHTRYWRDWSSDVCSSDLEHELHVSVATLPGGDGVSVDGVHVHVDRKQVVAPLGAVLHDHVGEVAPVQTLRSEERRVGKECRSRWSPYH